MIILFDNKDKSLRQVQSENAVNKLYYLEAQVPSPDQVNTFILKYTDVFKGKSRHTTKSKAKNKTRDKVADKVGDKAGNNTKIKTKINQESLTSITPTVTTPEITTEPTIPLTLTDQEAILHFFECFGIEQGIQEIRNRLSLIETQIPLYDSLDDNLYLINRFRVYSAVVYEHHRFPTKNFLNKLIERKSTYENRKITDQIEQRKYKKLSIMIPFLESFNLELLYKTYMTVFYLYADEVGKNITTCQRPSFKPYFKHIKPYYTRSEILNMAKNIGIKLEDRFYEPEDINTLCSKIRTNDITASTLLEHQKFIIRENKVGLVQYYTLQGSFFMNQYLRGMAPYEFKNIYLESLVTPMWNLLLKAPGFDKGYTIYRFIRSDAYLRDISIGDIHIEKGFISTTRDPFYDSETYRYGIILIKINIPGGVPGVGLCIETISHFPDEQEIILPPLTLLRLDKRDENATYYHTNEEKKANIRTRYEFTYVGKQDIRYIDRPLFVHTQTIDFLKIADQSLGIGGMGVGATGATGAVVVGAVGETLSLEEKVRIFLNRYVNPMFQFYTMIGDNKYTIICERYDSTGVYEDFYAVKNQNGFMFYTIYKDNKLFMIELGEDNGSEKYMVVNFYVRYSTLINRDKILGELNFIKFISSVAYYFGIEYVVLWAEYQIYDRGIVCKNLGGGAKKKQRSFCPKPSKFDVPKKVIDLKINSGPDPGLDLDFDVDIDSHNIGKYDKPIKVSQVSSQSDSDSDKNIDTAQNQKVINEITVTDMILGGYYCADYYLYLKEGFKKYKDIGISNVEIKPKFSYFQLDKLVKISPQSILKKDDRDELYQIYDKIFKTEVIDNSQEDNLKNFYIWVIENRCYLIKELALKMHRIYNVDNPFLSDFYILDPLTYLYNRKYIMNFPSFVYRSITTVSKRGKIPINEYRTSARRKYT